MKQLLAPASAIFLLSALSTAAYAQQVADANTTNADPAPPRIYTAPVAGLPVRFDNGIFVYGSAQAGTGRNSNVRATETNARSSNVTFLRPSVVGELQRGADRYTLSYRGNYTRYSNDKDFNANHHDITLAGDTYFSARSRLGLAADYSRRTDEPGQVNDPGSDSADRWTSRNLRGLYTYGAPGAPGRIELEGSTNAKRYQNNRANTEGSDLDTNALSGRFYWRVMPNTYAIAELRRTDNDYRLASSPNDNVDTRSLLGVTWDMTQLTSGTVKVGQQRKNYRTRDNVKRNTYEAELNWAPRSYSTVTFNASRAEQDAIDVGSSITNNSQSVAWSHGWSESLSSNLGWSMSKDNYRNAAGRIDDTTNLTAGLKYQVRSNVGLGLDLTRTKRDSNTAGFNYKRNTVFASVQVAL
jgi:hypothetical protein